MEMAVLNLFESKLQPYGCQASRFEAVFRWVTTRTSMIGPAHAPFGAALHNNRRAGADMPTLRVESHVRHEWDLEGDVVNERDAGVDQRCELARRQVHRVDR